MKGYGILLVITLSFFALLPPFAVNTTMGQPKDTVSTPVSSEDTVSVQISDSEGIQEFNMRELTRYEVMAQIAPDAPLEAIKAVALSVHTALCYQKEEGIPVRTTLTFPSCYLTAYWQEQWGQAYTSNMALFDEAVNAVYGKTIIYQNKPIMAVTHAMNGGVTEDGVVLFKETVPYLKSVASAADALDVGMLTTVTVSTADAKTRLGTLCQKVGDDPQGWFGETAKTAAGTVTSIHVCGENLAGARLQEAFALRSAAFDVNILDGNVVFTVHGSGHLTGLSVCGAIGMAQEGQTYETIIKHYFSGVAIQ